MQAHNAGNLVQAEELYNKILSTQPTHPDALHLKGVIFYQRKDFSRAIELIQSAIRVLPTQALYYSNLGNIFNDMGELEAASTAYKKALELNPKLYFAYNNLGLIYKKLKDYSQSLALFIKALELEPNYEDALHNCANLLIDLNQEGEALPYLERHISLNPKAAQPRFSSALIYWRKGEHNKALVFFTQALQLAPNRLDYWQIFIETISKFRTADPNDPLQDLLLSALKIPGLNLQDIMNPAMGNLLVKPDVSFWVQKANELYGGEQVFTQQELSQCKVIREEILLTQLMFRVLIFDRDVEKLLTVLRYSLLKNLLEDKLSGDLLALLSPFIHALCQQCFISEYVYYQTPEEMALAQKARDNLIPTLSMDDPAQRLAILIVACYYPLGQLVGVDTLEAGFPKYDSTLQSIIRQQVLDVAQELETAKHIETIFKIEDDVSLKVQNMYEENPYPRWDILPDFQPQTLPERVQRLFNYEMPNPRRAEDVHILIAGCGTGQQPLMAARLYPQSTILAVDLSRRSLAYATNKAKEYNISNVTFRHGDILKLSTTPQQFDYIECVGVLHHMQDPEAGWGVLLGALKPGGHMKIGLYSTLARQNIQAARNELSLSSEHVSVEKIRNTRFLLLTMSLSHPASNVTYRRDFYAQSSCRDLLYHVQEVCFTIPRIAAFLDKHNLEFIGFENDTPEIQKRYLEAYPSDTHSRSLTNWHEFEKLNPQSFAGMYQFWLRKRN